MDRHYEKVIPKFKYFFGFQNQWEKSASFLIESDASGSVIDQVCSLEQSSKVLS